jgi:iron(III) transport system ATP-binding protein
MLLKVDKIICRYGDQAVVDRLDFAVAKGEIVSLLGPSGCGKTTALRAIAGFEPISEGRIQLDGRTVSDPANTLAPEARHIGMVFQDYALFPHLTVADNIAFGLRDTRPAEQRATIDHLLEATGLQGLGERYPHELSGGQAQRVALARALAPKPLLLLMDEPFSNLDVELRERLSLEVRDILKTEGITGILVTHDQHEAFAVSDKVGVMHQGRILQWDTPYNLYHEPTDRFVADFIGQGEFLLGEVVAPDSFQTELGLLKTDKACAKAIGRKVDVLFRPDDIIPDEAGNVLARVVEKAFKGAEILYTLQLPSGSRLVSLFPSHRNHALGEEVRVRIDAQHLICFPHQG